MRCENVKSLRALTNQIARSTETSSSCYVTLRFAETPHLDKTFRLRANAAAGTAKTRSGAIQVARTHNVDLFASYIRSTRLPDLVRFVSTGLEHLLELVRRSGTSWRASPSGGVEGVCFFTSRMPGDWNHTATAAFVLLSNVPASAHFGPIARPNNLHLWHLVNQRTSTVASVAFTSMRICRTARSIPRERRLDRASPCFRIHARLLCWLVCWLEHDRIRGQRHEAGIRKPVYLNNHNYRFRCSENELLGSAHRSAGKCFKDYAYRRSSSK